MKKQFIILLAVLIAVISAGCSSGDSSSKKTLSDSPVTATLPWETTTTSDVDSDFDSGSDVDSDDALTPQKAAEMLTEPGKLWYRAGRGAYIGTINEWYYTFTENGDTIQAVLHTADGAEPSFTLRFYYNDSDLLRMRYDDVSGSWRDGFVPAQRHLDALGSYSRFYLDNGRLTFESIDLCKGDL